MNLLLALFLALSPERAVSQPVLETARRAMDARLASNGDLMLAVWKDWRSNESSDILAARITRDGVVLDPQGIVLASTPNREESPFVVWDGVQFVVFWFDNFGLHAASVDLEGRVTQVRDLAREAYDFHGAVRSDDRIAIAKSGVDVGLVHSDLTFERTTSLAAINGRPARLVAWAEGFLLVWPERNGLRVQRLDHDAKPYGLRLDVAIGYNASSLAADVDANGNAIIAAGGSGLTIVRIAPRDPGKLPVMTATRVRDTTHRADAVVVHASGYDVIAAEQQQPRVYRFGTDEVLLDVAEPLAGNTLSGGGADSGGRTFAAWTMSGMFAGAFAFDAAPAVQIAQHAPSQHVPVLAGNAQRTLIAWTEDIGGERERVMATRDGILRMIATRTADQPLAAACDATSCALAWTHENFVLVSRLDDDLTPREPLVLTGGHPAMVTNGTDTLLAWVDDSRVKTTFLSTSQIAEIPDTRTMPAVAFGRDSYLVVSTSPQHFLRGAIVDAGGRVLSTRDYTQSWIDAPVGVAWNGQHYLVVYIRWPGLRGLFVDADGRPDGEELTIIPVTPALTIPPSVAWDGAAFVVAHGPLAWRIGIDIAQIAPNASHPTLLPLGAGRTLLAYQRAVPELTNVQRVFTRVITPPRRRAFGAR